jgi:hypothetical protein
MSFDFGRAAVSGVALLFLLAGCGGASDERAGAEAGFCTGAEKLALGAGEGLSNDAKLVIFRQLSPLTPEDVRDEFGTLISWYEHMGRDHGPDEQTAYDASLEVGRFMESECDINLGGIRSE